MNALSLAFAGSLIVAVGLLRLRQSATVLDMVLARVLYIGGLLVFGAAVLGFAP